MLCLSANAMANSCPRDGNSVSANPQFTSTTDLHITQSGSAAANAGVVISGITTGT